jgi:hypothetical protein
MGDPRDVDVDRDVATWINVHTESVVQQRRTIATISVQRRRSGVWVPADTLGLWKATLSDHRWFLVPL